jgi:hypothetical protein
VGRLPALQDLSAHYAAVDTSVADNSGVGGSGSGSDAFKEGLEGDERDCTSFSRPNFAIRHEG